MKVGKFQIDKDLDRLETYLRNQYMINKNTTSWLPERLHDLIYRVSAHEADQGIEKSMDYIFLWEENEEIVACILPDGENIYFSIKKGFEDLFSTLLSYSEDACLPLFGNPDTGSVKFWVAVSSRLTYMQDVLKASGYQKYHEEAYDSFVEPLKAAISPILPEGFKLFYGEEYPDEEKKWEAHHLGFHSDDEGSDYKNSMNPYMLRKRSSMYQDSFECIVADENSQEQNNVCSYCFVYIDKQSKTALIEPVSTREKYRHMGIGTAMMRGVIHRCKEIGIEKCYVDSFGWRKEFYNAAGFVTEGSAVFWHKVIDRVPDT